MRVTAACNGYNANKCISLVLQVTLIFTLVSIISLAISIYGLWLLYNGLVEALKANKETAKIVIYILIAITVLIMIFSIGALGRTSRMMNEFKNINSTEIPQN